VTLRLLHYSDVENAYDDPERVGRLAGTLLAGDGGDALACGTGDNTAPGVLALRTEGGQSLDLFAAVEPDSETFGNHDLDLCAERTLELVPRSPQQWLTGNVYPADAPPGADPFGAGVGVRPWTVLEADGARVGLFGLTDPHTPDINPAAGGLAFRDTTRRRPRTGYDEPCGVPMAPAEYGESGPPARSPAVGGAGRSDSDVQSRPSE